MSQLRPLELLAERPSVLPLDLRDLAAASVWDRLVQDQLASCGLPPEAVLHAVLVGCRGGRLIEALRRHAPQLRTVVVLEPDPRSELSMRRDADAWSEGAHPLEIQVRPLDDVSPYYSHEIFLELVEFFTPRGGLTQTAWLLDPWAERSAQAAYRSASATVSDLFWTHGDHFIRLLDETGQLRDVFAGEERPRLLQCALQLLDQQAFYPALRFLVALYETGADPVIANQIVVSWAQLDCPDAALKWLQASDLDDTTRASMRSELEAASAAHSARAGERLETNLQALAASHPEAAAQLRRHASVEAEIVWVHGLPWALETRKQSLHTKRAPYPLMVQQSGSRLCELNAPEPPGELASKLQPSNVRIDPHVCIGALSNYGHLQNVLRNPCARESPNWKQLIYGIECQPARLRRLFEAFVLPRALAPGTFAGLFLGSAAESEICQYFAANDRLSLPQLHLGTSPAVEQGLSEVATARAECGRQAVRAIAGIYTEDFPHRLFEKVQAGQPLKIWGWSTIYSTVVQHVTRDLIAGFKALGHDARLLIESSNHECLRPAQLVSSIAEFEPDVLVVVDHTRPEYGFIPNNLPLVSWVIDDLPALRNPKLVERLTDLDLTFVWSLAIAEEFSTAGYPHCEQLPFAVNPESYTECNEGDVVVEDSVAYATHLAFPRDPEWAPGLYRKIEAELAKMDRIPSGVKKIEPILDAILGGAVSRMRPEHKRDLVYQGQMVARHADRVQTADILLQAGIRPALYGRGWSAIERFRKYARGIVSPGPSLRRMYAGHKVVLHTNPHCNFHPRVLEASLAGGFVLARSDGAVERHPGQVGDFLEIGRELCMYDSRSDMVAKIERARVDEAWRRSFIRAAQRRIAGEHTYVHRARAIMAALQRQLTKVTHSALAG